MQNLMAKLARIRESNGGVIETKEAEAQGITNADLSMLCSEGKIVRIAKGKYVIPKDKEDDMARMAYNNKLLFSHQSALYLHGILDSPGEKYAVTCVEGTEPDEKIKAMCDVHYVSPEMYELGRTMETTQRGNLVPTYDLERSICDIALARDEVGQDVFLNAITRYAQDTRCNEKQLYEYGDKLNITYVLQCYLEVLMWARTS